MILSLTSSALNASYDRGRTYELEELNIKVIRFTNSEVLEKIDFVLSELEKHLIPNLLPKEKGGKRLCERKKEQQPKRLQFKLF